jgi:hypothetical protein
MRRRGIHSLLALWVLVGGVAMADPKAESESLLNAALPFAQKMLKENGEFYPYAFTLRADCVFRRWRAVLPTDAGPGFRVMPGRA